MNNAIKIFGGKTYLADWIISLIPSHTTFCEPFFGGGAVLFKKECQGISEVVNDIDGHLINFWKVLQLPHLFEIFKRHIEAIPFSQKEWQISHNLEECLGYNELCNDGRVFRAINFFVNCRQSMGGMGKSFAPISKSRTRRGMNEQVSSWLSAVEGLPEVHNRLKRILILNMNAIQVINNLDCPNCVFYLDPPYLPETRTAKKVYKYEMSLQQHIELLNVLENIKGKFILSGYESELYNSWAGKNKYRVEKKEISNHAAKSDKKRRMVECLYMNY